MPELPEVETVRAGLSPAIKGRRIDRVELRRGDLRRPFPPGFADALAGRTVQDVRRRAKYLLLDLDDGAVLVIHLGMSGSLRVESEGDARTPGVFHRPRAKAGPHDHVVFHLDSGTVVTFNDPRRFGVMDLLPLASIDEAPAFKGLGVEPLGEDFDGASLARLLAGKAAPLKAALLDQRLIAGLGNIYVCEALWEAQLKPTRAAGSIVRKDGKPTVAATRLAAAIRSVLEAAVKAGGSSLRDHRQTDGSLGYFQHSFRVYDREGQACLRPHCRGVIRRTVQAGRSTFYCPVCQK